MSIRSFARAAIVAGTALVATGAANADVFLKVTSAPGDANQRGYEEQIVLSGASLSISSFIMPDPDGLVDTVRSTNVGNLMLNKTPDRSSPKLMLSAVNGDPLGTIEISFTSPARPGSAPSVESRWIVEGAEVRSFNVYPGANPGDPPVETIEISYASMRYQHFDKGLKGGAATMEEVKWQVPDDQLFPFDEGCR